jgi:hypothetical protein
MLTNSLLDTSHQPCPMHAASVETRVVQVRQRLVAARAVVHDYDVLYTTGGRVNVCALLEVCA